MASSRSLATSSAVAFLSTITAAATPCPCTRVIPPHKATTGARRPDPNNVVDLRPAPNSTHLSLLVCRAATPVLRRPLLGHGPAVVGPPPRPVSPLRLHALQHSALVRHKARLGPPLHRGAAKQPCPAATTALLARPAAAGAPCRRRRGPRRRVRDVAGAVAGWRGHGRTGAQHYEAWLLGATVARARTTASAAACPFGVRRVRGVGPPHVKGAEDAVDQAAGRHDVQPRGGGLGAAFRPPLVLQSLAQWPGLLMSPVREQVGGGSAERAGGASGQAPARAQNLLLRPPVLLLLLWAGLPKLVRGLPREPLGRTGGRRRVLWRRPRWR